MRWLAALVLLAGAGTAAAPAKKDPYAAGDLWKDATVLAELIAAEKALDAHLGQIPKRPRILLSTREYAFKRSLEDVRGAAQATTSDEWFLRSAAMATALGAFAFYEPGENTVHIIPQNFEAAARRKEDAQYLSREFLRLVLIHELVHTWDNQVNDLDTQRKKNRTPSQWKIFNAVSEGHAQFVTKQVMVAMKRPEQFQRFNDAVFGTGDGPANEEPAERFLRTRAILNGRFGYVDGLVFYEGLAKRRSPDLLAAPFRVPPNSVSEILHPDRYDPKRDPLAPREPRPLELGIAMRRFVDAQEPGWAVMPIPVDEHVLRSDAASLLDPKKVGTTLEPFIAASSFAARPGLPDTRAELSSMLRTGVYRQVMVCTAVQMRDAESASRFLAMQQRLATVEGETLAKGQTGAVPTLKNGPLAPSGSAKGLTNFRSLSVLQQGSKRDSRVVVGLARGSIAAGCEFFASPRTDERLTDLLDTLATELAILDEDGAP